MTSTPQLSVDDQLQLLLRDVEHCYSPPELARRLASAAKQSRPLRIKLGMDPTAPDLHLGHAVVLRKMRQFQDLGHKAVFIIGDATAAIGDPTGKTKTRPVLSPEQVQANAKSYFTQAGKILDLTPEKIEIRYNSEWFSKMSFTDALKLQMKMTVARMLERDTFQKRHAAGEPIYIHEFSYPLMQGWDSVMVKSDVELGGTDQTFNNLAGRDLQESEGQPPQIVIVMPILPGTDGVHKMSKSLGNSIGVSDSPAEQFGKAMSIPDSLMAQWFKLCTPLAEDRILSLVDSSQSHPRAAKEVLGRAIVEQYHGTALAESAAEEFRRRFSEHQIPTDIETRTIPASFLKDGQIGILTLIKEVGFAPSTSQARQLVEGGGVTYNNQKITDPKLQVTVEDRLVLQVGKRRICKVQINPA